MNDVLNSEDICDAGLSADEYRHAFYTCCTPSRYSFVFQTARPDSGFATVGCLSEYLYGYDYERLEAVKRRLARSLADRLVYNEAFQARSREPLEDMTVDLATGWIIRLTHRLGPTEPTPSGLRPGCRVSLGPGDEFSLSARYLMVRALVHSHYIITGAQEKTGQPVQSEPELEAEMSEEELESWRKCADVRGATITVSQPTLRFVTPQIFMGAGPLRTGKLVIGICRARARECFYPELSVGPSNATLQQNSATLSLGEILCPDLVIQYSDYLHIRGTSRPYHKLCHVADVVGKIIACLGPKLSEFARHAGPRRADFLDPSRLDLVQTDFIKDKSALGMFELLALSLHQGMGGE